MELVYKDIKEIEQAALINLFKSVEWQSANYPQQLTKAISNYGSVFTAWDGEKCVGLVSAFDDGIMVAYVHYVLVDPEYQKYGIGKKLMEMTLEHYQDYHKVCLIGVNTATGFYEHLGFVVDNDAKPMFYVNENYGN